MKTLLLLLHDLTGCKAFSDWYIHLQVRRALKRRDTRNKQRYAEFRKTQR